jgi:SdpC family antimicrobial peptide
MKLTITRGHEIVAATLAFTMFATGCGSPGGTGSSGGSSSDPSTQTAPARTDGETIFRGLYLNMGPVAGRVPELNDPKSAVYAEQDLSKESIAKYLEGAAERMRVSPETAGTADSYATAAADLRTGKLSPEEMLAARRDYQTTSAEAIVGRVRAADPTFFDRFATEMQSGDHVRVGQAFEDGAKRFVDAASVVGALPGHVVPEAKCLFFLVAVVWAAVYVSEAFWDKTVHPLGDLHQAEVVDLLTTRLAAE